MVPEIRHNYVDPENSTWGQLPLFFLWFLSATCSAIYIIVNDIDFLIALNVYGNVTFYGVVICMKLYNIQKYKNVTTKQTVQAVKENNTCSEKDNEVINSDNCA